MTNLMILTLFGGVLLLLYGIQLAGEGLKEAAGAQIKSAFRTLTRNRVAALFTGVGVTFLLQSSSATTVLLVGFVDAGLMSLAQTMGVILGADVGTTLTVQLIAFRIENLAVFIAGVGLLLMFVGSRPERKSLGKGILGFGLIFLSIKIMAEAMAPLRENLLFQDLLLAVGQNPLAGILVAAAITAILHSSAATLGLVITLSLQDLITLPAALPIILGANIGTCITAYLGSLRAKSDAKRVAWAHILFKALGTLLVFPFLGPFARLTELTSADLARQIANAHTIFNLGLALVFLPFTGAITRLTRVIVSEKAEPIEEKFAPKYLSASALSDPSLALAQAAREALRMAEVVQDMLKLSLDALLGHSRELIELIENMDDRVDLLDRAIRFFLTQLSRKALTEEEAGRQMEILQLVSNLESVGDVIDKNLMELAKKRLNKQVEFSAEGRQDIQELHARVLENLELALSAFTGRDQELAQKVLRHKPAIRELEQDLYQRHIQRLEAGLSESFETSSIHLDVIANLKRINSLLTNIIYPLVQSPEAPLR